jgi:hypothetical protein
VQTKRGENAYHGSLFYNNKNSALAAWDYNDKIGQENFLPNAFQSSYPNPYFNLNEMGGSFSTRVRRVGNLLAVVHQVRHGLHALLDLWRLRTDLAGQSSQRFYRRDRWFRRRRDSPAISERTKSAAEK